MNSSWKLPHADARSLLLFGFLGLVLVPVAWAVRAPDGPFAPLPDYDIRKGYNALPNFSDPRVAAELPVLREQHAAKRAAAAETPEPTRPGNRDDEIVATFGEGVLTEWNARGVLRHLASGDTPLAPPQPGANPEAVARGFLRTHQGLFGLNDAVCDALRATRKMRDDDGTDITFRQTVGDLPVFQAELKVSLDEENAVLSVSGTLFPELSVASAGKLSAVEGARAAAQYVGPLVPYEEETDILENAPEKQHPVEFNPEVIAAKPGPEQETDLSRGPFMWGLKASQVVFPLSATQGRVAWQVSLQKAPMESYSVVVDAEDGVLLNRTNRVKFSSPQGLVFLTHPDAAAQVIQSFVGNPKASKSTFVNSQQSGTQGNNVFGLHVASDGSGPRHFEFAFTNAYQNNGEDNFNLDTDRTIRFVPNVFGGYDMTLVTFSDAPAGSNLFLSDDSYTCLTPPSGFVYFGSAVSQVCVNSNGEMNINWSNTDLSESGFEVVGQQGRIMGLWDDLNPSYAGFVGSSFAPGSGELCVRWNNVPEYYSTGSNSFSICIFGSPNSAGLPAGTIQLSYPNGGVTALDGYVGISPGGSLVSLNPLTPNPDTLRTVALTNFDAPASTVGPIGFVKRFPSSADAAAGATNIFFHLNQNGHDREYPLGFKEKTRNMQNDNFAKGGLGNDPIWSWYTGSSRVAGTNNAFFSTSPEGQCCPLTAFLPFTNPPFLRRESAFDSDIVIHEHGHGVSTRLTGGLDTIQSGAMGEGWSDWFALDYSGDPVMGEYVTGNSSTGIRDVRYDASSPRHFGDFGNLLGPFTYEPFYTGLPASGTVFYTEVHADGEIWATNLADLRTALLGGGLSSTNMSKLIIKALKVTSANASMLEARDKLLAKGPKLGASKCSMWPVFAANGFGRNAGNNEAPDTGLASDSYSVFQSFDRDSSCGGSFSSSAAPLYTYNFDSANVGDTSADGWAGTSQWHVSDNRFSTGSRSFYFGNEVSGNYSTGFRAYGNLTSPVLDLSATTHPVLEMSLYMVAEEFFPFDMLRVRVSTNGGASYPIQRSLFFWDTNTAFRTVRIDLEPLAGQANARIQLYFETFDGAVNLFEGVFIDNINIRNYTEN